MLPLVAPSLTSLFLTFFAVDAAHLTSLARRTVLEEFIGNDLLLASPLSYHALVPLGQFWSLRELSISSSTCQSFLLTDDEFDSLLESLPSLQHFLLVVKEGMPGLSGAALRSIGERYRDLVALEMSGAWDLSHLRKSSFKFIFPKLAVLWLLTASAEREDPETGGYVLLSSFLLANPPAPVVAPDQGLISCPHAGQQQGDQLTVASWK
jgi:hypothetical protein